MNTAFLENIATHITTFWDKTSEHWFYYFSYNWVVFRGNQGYATRKLAEEAAFEHARSIDAETGFVSTKGRNTL